MLLMFLVFIGLLASYLYLNTTGEVIHIMTMATLAISVIFASALTPWQVKLLIIILVLTTTRKFSSPKSNLLG